MEPGIDFEAFFLDASPNNAGGVLSKSPYLPVTLSACDMDGCLGSPIFTMAFLILLIYAICGAQHRIARQLETCSFFSGVMGSCTVITSRPLLEES